MLIFSESECMVNDGDVVNVCIKKIIYLFSLRIIGLPYWQKKSQVNRTSTIGL